MTVRSSPPAPESPPAPYRLEYAVWVWKQVMGLAPEEIALLGRGLERLAAQAAQLQGCASARRDLHLDHLAVSYEVSEGRQVLTVLDVGRRAPSAD